MEEDLNLKTEAILEKKYKQPRILEALCDLQFMPSADWNTSAYGMLLTAVKDIGFEQTEELPRFTIQIAPAMKKTEVKHDHVLMRYKHSDENWLLQLSSETFTVNQLAPYPGWGIFKPRILEATKRFRQAIPSAQTRRVTLRYINHFEFEGNTIDLNQWFTLYPNAPLLGTQKGPFLLRQEFNLDNGDMIAATTGLAYPSKPDHLAVLLDIEYQYAPQGVVTVDSFENILEKAHQEIYRAFEAFITDQTRHLLQEVK